MFRRTSVSLVADCRLLQSFFSLWSLPPWRINFHTTFQICRSYRKYICKTPNCVLREVFFKKFCFLFDQVVMLRTLFRRKEKHPQILVDKVLWLIDDARQSFSISIEDSRFIIWDSMEDDMCYAASFVTAVSLNNKNCSNIQLIIIIGLHMSNATLKFRGIMTKKRSSNAI